MELTLKQLRALEALEMSGQFSKAAETLHITQPALSAQIAALEENLGVKLVERGARQCRLTEAGRIALKTSDKIHNFLREMRDEIHQAGFPSPFSLGAIPTIAPYLMPNLLIGLEANYPDISVSITEDTTEALLSALRDGHLHAVIAALPIADPQLEEFPLAQDQFLLASKNPPLRPNLPTKIPADQMLLLADGHCLGDQALELCQMSRSEINSTATSLHTLLGLADAGFGVTLIPNIAKSFVERSFPNLKLTEFDGIAPSRQLGLIVRQASAQQEWVGLFLKELSLP